MKIIFLLLILFPLLSWAQDYDLSKRYGITVAAGYDDPIGGNAFDDRADGEFMFGLKGRYQLDGRSAFELGYTRYEWSHSPTAARVYDIMYLNRIMPRERFTPLLGVGVGAVDVANYSDDENLKLGLRARLGIESALSPDLFLAGVIDYQYVSRMPGERNGGLTIGNINAVAPQLNLTYYFAKD